MRKAISLILAVSLALCSLSGAAFAAPDSELFLSADEISLEFNEETLEPNDEEPSEPNDEEPSEPSDEEPSEPSDEEPSEPSGEESSESSDEESSEPSGEESSESSDEESSEPSDEEPSEPDDEETSESDDVSLDSDKPSPPDANNDSEMLDSENVSMLMAYEILSVSNDGSYSVSTWAELQSAIANASSEDETVINITEDITADSYFPGINYVGSQVPSGTKVTINGNGHTITMPNIVGQCVFTNGLFVIEDAELKLQSVTIIETGTFTLSAPLKLNSNAKVDLIDIDLTCSSRASNTGCIYIAGTNTELNLYSGTIQNNGYNGSYKNLFYVVQSCELALNLKPTGDINLTGDVCFSSSDTSVVNVYSYPQDGISITSVVLDDEDVTKQVVEGGTAYELSSYGSTKTTTISLSIIASPSDESAEGSGDTDSGVSYSWSYGGNITADGEILTITPFTADGVTYVIEKVVVDDKAVEVKDPTQPMMITNATQSVAVTFAYTLTITEPRAGELTVTRDGVALANGDIVHKDEVLEIEYTDPEGGYSGVPLLTGITDNGNNTYTVSAGDGDQTPAVSVDLTQKGDWAETPTIKLVSTVHGGVVSGTMMSSLNNCVIECETEGADIYYTIDGNTPTTESTKYTAPIPYSDLPFTDENAFVTIKAIAVKEGLHSSEVAEITYKPYYVTLTLTGDGSIGLTYTVYSTTVNHMVPLDGTQVDIKVPLCTQVYFEVIPPDGKILKRLGYNESASGDITTSRTLEMLIDRTVTAVCERGYDISWNEDGDAGSFVVNGTTVTQACEGQTVEVLLPPIEKGNCLDTLAYTYEGHEEPVDITDSKSFTMPAAAVTVTMTQKPITGEMATSIKTEEDLRKLAENVNSGMVDYIGVTVTLENDVALTEAWTSIGTYDHPFTGHFDGQGYTISNLSGHTLFGYAENGSIKNVTVSGTIYFTSMDDRMAPAAGIVVSATNETISGCINCVDLSSAYHSTMGGIAAMANNSRIVNCVNYGSVGITSSANNKAGIVADSQGTTVDSCVNYGSVMGWSSSAGISISGTVTNSVNHGAISCSSGYAMGIGGSIVSDCYNTGSVKATRSASNYSYLAFGISSGGNVTNSYNVGTVTSASDGPSSSTTQDGSVFPISYTGTVENSYYLEGCLNGSIGSIQGTSKTEAELKELAGTLGENWIADTHGINNGYPILAWESELDACEVTFDVSSPENVTLTVNGDKYTKNSFTIVIPNGRYVIFTIDITSAGVYKVGNVTIGQDLELSTDSEQYVYQVTDSCNINISIVKKETSEITAGKDENVIDGALTAPASVVWDGESVDVSWYFGHEDETTYRISTAAELAGVAALVNGLVNKNCTVYTDKTTYTAAQWNVVGGGFVFEAGAVDTGSLGQNLSTDIYHYGIEDFNGKTIILTDNIDMGGVYSSKTLKWSGPNYMPIGGQYLMESNDPSTKLSSSFCGTFDGNGHYVYNIYCDRRCNTGNYGDGQSVGLIGRLGVHDSDPAEMRPVQPTVKNVGVTGYVYANRSVAGVVGKVGKTAYNNDEDDVGAVIENCVNYARVIGTDAKGTGGVVGANWNGGLVLNCYNMGNVTGGWPAGGVVGTNENHLQNCYNTGTIDSSSGANWAQAIGTRNGVYNEAVVNCYYLENSSTNLGYFYNATSVSNEGEMTEADMKAAAFVNQLNGSDRDYPGTYAVDTVGINNGYPVLKWQLSNTASKDIVSDSGASLGTVMPEKPEETVLGIVTEVADGTATVTMDSESLIGKLDEMQKDEESVKQIVIEADIPEGETVDKVTVVLTADDTAAIAKAGATLKTVSPLAEITLSGDVLKAVAKQDEDGSAQVTVTASVQEESGAVAIEVAVSGKVMENVAQSGILVTLPVDEEAISAGSVLVMVDAEGNETVIKKSVMGESSISALLDGSCTVKVVDNAVSFPDVAEEDWFLEAIDFATSHELFIGEETGLFNPEGDMTRAMLVTVLHRLENTPDANIVNTFGDIPDDEWFADSVRWAAENSIVIGYSEDVFAPDDSITREQIVVMVYRYAKLLGLDVTGQAELDQFTDIDELSDWAVEAMEWAMASGLILGNEDGTLNPAGNATRAEVAAIIQRLIGQMMQVS